MSGKQAEEYKSIDESLLLSPYTMWAVLFFLLIAIWFKFVPVIVVSALLLLLSSVTVFWRRKSLTRVKPLMNISKSRLFAGEEFVVEAEIHNDKWMPLIWLEWVFPKYEEIFLCESEREIYTIRFLWLLWFQQVKWELQGKALNRGVYDVGEITLRSGDGFRFSETEKIYSLNQNLYVYPKLLHVSVPNFNPSMKWGVKGKQGGFIEDPLLITGIREYQAGDELKRLNWGASARTNKLQTNVYQTVITKQLVIYIDVQGFVINEIAVEEIEKLEMYRRREKESFEHFLSVIASVALKYKEQGISLGFASNALNKFGGKMATLPPAANLTPLLDELAKITENPGVKKFTVLDEMLHKRMLSAPLFIFCREVTEAHYIWYQQHKHKLSDVYFYYINEKEYAKRLGLKAKPIDTFLSSFNL